MSQGKTPVLLFSDTDAQRLLAVALLSITAPSQPRGIQRSCHQPWGTAPIPCRPATSSPAFPRQTQPSAGTGTRVSHAGLAGPTGHLGSCGCSTHIAPALAVFFLLLFALRTCLFFQIPPRKEADLTKSTKRQSRQTLLAGKPKPGCTLAMPALKTFQVLLLFWSKHMKPAASPGRQDHLEHETSSASTPWPHAAYPGYRLPQPQRLGRRGHSAPNTSPRHDAGMLTQKCSLCPVSGTPQPSSCTTHLLIPQAEMNK